MDVFRVLIAGVLVMGLLAVGGPQAAAQEQVAEPELRQEILSMVEEGEALRDSLDRVYGVGQPLSPQDSARVEALTEEHVERLSDIIREHDGWPGKSLVGEDGSQGAWVIAQYADGHLQFQRAALSFLKEAVEEGEADPRDMAYLEDRLRVSQGRQQVYGTQVRFVQGQPRPFPIEDAESVDERRAEVGLQPLQDYLNELQAMQ